MIKLNYPKFWSNKNILSSILLPFSYIYKLLGWVRKMITEPIKLPGFVICVGNMSVGGTGKTQFVIWLSKQLAGQNYSFLIITKGYKSKLRSAKLVQETDNAIDVGDESILLRQYGRVLATKSIKDALPIIERLKPQIIIFDDGMQNPGFFKDLVVLMVDAKRHVGNGRIFPAGPLRQEASDAINQADIIVMIGNQSSPNLQLKLDIKSSLKPAFEARIRLVDSIDLSKKYYAFTGIGDPFRFFDLLKESGVNLLRTFTYPDHYHYPTQEINMLKEEARKYESTLITTKKDYVKIRNNDDISCAESILLFDQEKKLLQLIYEKIKAYS